MPIKARISTLVLATQYAIRLSSSNLHQSVSSLSSTGCGSSLVSAIALNYAGQAPHRATILVRRIYSERGARRVSVSAERASRRFEVTFPTSLHSSPAINALSRPPPPCRRLLLPAAPAPPSSPLFLKTIMLNFVNLSIFSFPPFSLTNIRPGSFSARFP